MSMGRRRVNGDVPEEIYVVSYGDTHKVYSKLKDAKGVRTRDKRYNKNIKIFRALITDWEEVDV